jgi:predicted ATPase
MTKRFASATLLIRDAAYDGLPKATRAELHERFATWLEHVDSDLSEREEIAGWHLERAVRYRRELGHDPDTELGRRAAAHLHRAGRRATARGDALAARNPLERALVLAADDDARRAAITVDLAEALIDGGEPARADALLTAVERQPEVAAHASLNRLEWLVL